MFRCPVTPFDFMKDVENVIYKGTSAMNIISVEMNDMNILQL